MSKFVPALVCLFFAAVPALAKPGNIYPVSCGDLWSSVKETLQNQRNYSIVSMDDLNRRASFVVVGDLTQYTDRVELAGTGGTCQMKSTFLEVGAYNGDFRQFHHRLARSLAKLQAGKPETAQSGYGQQ